MKCQCSCKRRLPKKCCLNHQWAACERDSHIPELSIPSIVRSFQQPNSVVSSRVLSWGALVAGARVMNRKVRRQKLYSVTWAKQDRPANRAGGTRENGANLWLTIVLCRNSSQRDWNRILKWSLGCRTEELCLFCMSRKTAFKSSNSKNPKWKLRVPLCLQNKLDTSRAKQ